MSGARFGKRRGLALVSVLVCLVVAASLVATTVRAALRDRREARLQLQLRQTELLCEAGVLRAAQKLRSQSNYQKEVWQPELPIESLRDASVAIDVAESPDDLSEKIVTVVARLDSTLDNDGPMQRTHTFTFQTSAPSTTAENP